MSEYTLEAILKEVRYGQIKLNVQNGKIVSVPEQEIILPSKIENIEVFVKIRKPITIKETG